MTQQSTPWDGILTGDATIAPYSALEWSRIWQLMFGSGTLFPNYGVFAGSGDGTNEPLAVLQTTVASVNVEVQIGAALVNGKFYENTAIVALSPAANSSGNPRIDTVILRADFVSQTVRLAIKQGTPAGSPVHPTLQQDTSFWEIPLADIALTNGWTGIGQGNITQRRRIIDTQSQGWQPYAYPINYSPGVAAGSAGTLTPAQTYLVPFNLSGNMLLERLDIYITAVLNGLVAWDIYANDKNDGNTADNTLRRIVQGGSNLVAGGTTQVYNIPTATPVPLTPGQYWVAIQNQGSQNFDVVAIAGNVFDATLNTIKRKATTNPNGATIDAVTATWTPLSIAICARLTGRVYGLSTGY